MMFAPDNKAHDDFIIPAGSYAARLYLLVDLGHQYVQYPGKPGAWSHKIHLGWEIPELTFEAEDKETGEKTIKPRVIGKEYTLSYYASAHLKVDIQSWIGRELTANEQEKGYAIDGLLGKLCMLSVAHKDGKDKDGHPKTYANIAAVMACPRGLTVPALFNPIVLYDMDNDPGNKVFDGLYEWLQKKIRKSQEFAEPASELEPPLEEATDDAPLEESSDTDVPFADGPITDEQMFQLKNLYADKKLTKEQFLGMFPEGVSKPSGLSEVQAARLIRDLAGA